MKTLSFNIDRGLWHWGGLGNVGGILGISLVKKNVWESIWNYVFKILKIFHLYAYDNETYNFKSFIIL